MNAVATILHMDDDPVLRPMIRDVLAARGFDVVSAADGGEGMDLFVSRGADLVLVDLDMPVKDGFAVIREVLGRSPDTPVIVLSGQGGMDEVIRALRLGACDYVAKPVVSSDVLVHRIGQALEKARLRRENQAYQRGLEARLGAVVENFPGLLFICDPSCRISYANPALVSHLGRDPVGEPCHEAVFGLAGPCPWCPEAGSLAAGAVHDEVRSGVDGRWYHLIEVPVLDRAGSLVERQVILQDITERKKAEEELREQEERLREENLRLRDSLSERYRFGSIIGRSRVMQAVYETILNAAATDAGVIIYGESGTGKELVAREIHAASRRRDRPMIYVNCGAIPEPLAESEFFGYRKGAFTGAERDKHGFLDLADGGTLFLDEIGEIPLSMQVKLLRALEGNGYSPVGSALVKYSDVRIIAATSRDLKEMVRQGRMRQDFLYRIHIIPVNLPPLRDRREDIPLLVEHFLASGGDEPPPVLPAAVIQALCEYDWPGNVRELQNTVNRFVTLGRLDFLNVGRDGGAGLLPDEEVAHLPLREALSRLERELIVRALARHGGHQARTAASLGIGVRTLYRKMRNLGIALR